MEREHPYWLDIPSVSQFGELVFDTPVTFLIGENGAGKSTLLEAIAINYGFNAEGGTKNFRFSTRETSAALSKFITLVKEPVRPQDGYFLRAESFYNAASYIDDVEAQGSYGGKSLHEQSHGESFLSLVMNRFGRNGLYLLDEPEAALSPSRQLALICRINDLVQAGSQFIIATHSPILMAYPNATLYLLDEAGIRKTRYEETEHYLVTREFLRDPQRMLRTLLSEEE